MPQIAHFQLHENDQIYAHSIKWVISHTHLFIFLTPNANEYVTTVQHC